MHPTLHHCTPIHHPMQTLSTFSNTPTFLPLSPTHHHPILCTPLSPDLYSILPFHLNLLPLFNLSFLHPYPTPTITLIPFYHAQTVNLTHIFWIPSTLTHTPILFSPLLPLLTQLLSIKAHPSIHSYMHHLWHIHWRCLLFTNGWEWFMFSERPQKEEGLSLDLYKGVEKTWTPKELHKVCNWFFFRRIWRGRSLLFGSLTKGMDLSRTLIRVPCPSKDFNKYLCYALCPSFGLYERVGICPLEGLWNAGAFPEPLQKSPAFFGTFMKVCNLHCILPLGYMFCEVPVPQDVWQMVGAFPCHLWRYVYFTGSLLRSALCTGSVFVGCIVEKVTDPHEGLEKFRGFLRTLTKIPCPFQDLLQ